MRTAIIAVLVAGVWVTGATPAAAQQLAKVPSMCADCHGGVVSSKLEAVTHADSVSCLTCHHIGYTTDPDLAASRRLDACSGCHEDLLTSHWGVEEDEPACTECHSIHEDPPLEEADARLSSQCAGCHTSSHTLHSEAGVEAPACTQCHTVHTGAAFHGENESTVAQCSSCHEDVHPAHSEVEGGLTCTACHSMDVVPLQEPGSSPYAEECASCHADVHPTHVDAGEDGPSCVSCHAFATDPPIAGAGITISQRCGECHTDEMDGFAVGGHAEGMARDPNRDLPNCLTCHATYVDPGEERAQVRLAATVRCIECHSEETLIDQYGLPNNVGGSYVDDFHGATTRFLWDHPGSEVDQPPVMVCSDCHGAHDVGWSETDVVAEVCASCHEAGDDRLAGAWLGHDRVGPGNKWIVWLIRVFYYFMIPFMLGGLFLNIAFHLVDQRRKGARIANTEGVQKIRAWIRREKKPEVESVVRFNVKDRLEHVGSMVTFILLVVTGLPQTRPGGPISNAIIGFFGGIGGTRFVHRVAGFLFVALMLIHVTRIVVKAVRARRLPIMVPTRKDFEDVVQTFRHFLFKEPAPKVGKFDAAEKFEYWGLFAGGLVMSGTGIILVFPELVSQILPGILVAATRVMHGLEATFAVLVVALWHAYGVSLRPEVFPLDTSIFSGKMSVERLKHEHPLEYERLFPERAAAEAAEQVEEGVSEVSSPMLARAEDGLIGA
jgi:cytochrome b subunit of formate dehydrogenase